jgi:hypothetical protein
MAGTEKPKADRRQKRRAKQQAEREHTGDTPEAVAERAKAAAGKQYDAEALKKLGERTGVYL